MKIIFAFAMFILGACLGSFLCCQARRLHIRATAKGNRQKSLGPRSLCLHCHRPLKWYDNLPIISWLVLHGKCRHCHQKIGLLELFSELGTALALLLLSNTVDLVTATPLTWATFITVVIFALTAIFLAIYDGAYGELPTLCLVFAIIFATIVLALKSWPDFFAQPFSMAAITNPLISVLILGGLYLALYLISKGKWVGDGDWLLSTALALALGHPWLALIALSLANLLACLVGYPITKLKNRRQIHFGPFLVTAFIVTYSFSSFFLGLVL